LGNYLASTWVAASDGHGGTVIHDPVEASGQSNGAVDQPLTGSAMAAKNNTLRPDDDAADDSAGDNTNTNSSAGHLKTLDPFATWVATQNFAPGTDKDEEMAAWKAARFPGGPAKPNKSADDDTTAETDYDDRSGQSATSGNSNATGTSTASGGLPHDDPADKGSLTVPDIAFHGIDLGQAATVANWLPTHDTGGSLGEGVSLHDRALARFGQSMAGFSTADKGHGATSCADPPPDQQHQLSFPHA